MKLFYSDTFELPLPSSHRFPMSKYRLLRERVAASDELADCELVIPEAATDDQLATAHHREYIERVVTGTLSDLEIRRIGFPWSEKMVERSRRSVGGTIAAARHALSDGVACNLAGGTHHACAESGQGYCVFNDAVVAANVLRRDGQMQSALFVDTDVHQGNGTARLTENDSRLFSFSLHCEKNFPFRKATSDLDITLPERSSDGAYLAALDRGLRSCFERIQPDLVFYLAGADAFVGDRLGKLDVSKAALRMRDEMVLEFCRSRNVPVAIAMAGGYAPDVQDIVDIHFETLCIARCWFDGSKVASAPANRVS